MRCCASWALVRLDELVPRAGCRRGQSADRPRAGALRDRNHRALRAVRATHERGRLPLVPRAGVYRHYIPPVIGALAMRGEFLTRIRPTRPKCRKATCKRSTSGDLHCAAHRLDVANASVYDGATALAEGVVMAITPPAAGPCSCRRPCTELSCGLQTYARWFGDHDRRVALRCVRHDRLRRTAAAAGRPALPRWSCSRRIFSARSTFRRQMPSPPSRRQHAADRRNGGSARARGPRHAGVVGATSR